MSRANGLSMMDEALERAHKHLYGKSQTKERKMAKKATAKKAKGMRGRQKKAPAVAELAKEAKRNGANGGHNSEPKPNPDYIADTEKRNKLISDAYAKVYKLQVEKAALIEKHTAEITAEIRATWRSLKAKTSSDLYQLKADYPGYKARREALDEDEDGHGEEAVENMNEVRFAIYTKQPDLFDFGATPAPVKKSTAKVQKGTLSPPAEPVDQPKVTPIEA